MKNCLTRLHYLFHVLKATWRYMDSFVQKWLMTAGYRECVCVQHRRRIYTEEKAKVVAADWATEIIQFLAALAIFHHDIL